MRNYEDVIMKGDDKIIKLRMIFTDNYLEAFGKEYIWDGRIFKDEADINFYFRYKELIAKGYKEIDRYNI